MDNSISINKTNPIYFRFPMQNNGNDLKLSSSENAIQLSGYNVGGAILARNNITFRNLATPIEVTDKYNKKIEGKDHLDLPNIHVYEYPDTNLQVFICENDNSNDEKDRILMKFNIHNNIDDKDDFIKKELCTRLFCNLINYDNDDCFVTTFDSDFFSVNYNLTNKNYKRIREINKLIVMTKQKGYSLVPLSMYFKGSLVKVELGVGKGKKLYDKREDIAKKDAKRNIERSIKNYNRY